MTGFSVLWAALVVQASQPAPVVRISAAELARAPRLTITREPVWRIGGEADGPYGFARIVGGTFRRDGGVAVLESNPTEVRRYNDTGKHLSSFGRRGRGPGEFENVQRLMSHTGDSLVVSQLYHVSVFDEAGRHARTISTANTETGLALAYRVLSDGSLLSATRPMPKPQEQSQRREGVTRDSTHIVILSADGATVARDLGRRPSGESVVARHGVALTLTSRAFVAGLLIEGGDSLVFVLKTDALRLEVLHASTGKEIRTIAISLTPRSVAEADRAEFARSRREGAARGQNAAIATSGVEAYLKLMTYPDHMPYFDAVRWSYDRVVKLRRYVAPLDSTAQWLGLTPTGQLLSLIDLPAKARVLDFDRDRVLLVERDVHDLEYLAVYKLVPRKL